ncbi:MAG TPA: ferrous iron transport protein A [Clostridia bacterium]|jgi:ferrous iron transport protein A|nr:ferrous iron transport protein A [Clostridiaceae bacterium]HOF26462.1 ferrous iron transport protein A [Clostridia bacterium]HOM34078.1 ferrous iron transport protein A [Clostridia bacterium]HOR89657.1 ferrous iron transport protein A [Clostridia bacterium]HOT71165.1 ferrous iron transport protein A [Clostridia bacterium]
METLDKVKAGQSVTVRKIRGTGPVKKRLMDMGITQGTEITVVKLAPLGDPIEMKLRGYDLSIRKADAELVEVE